MVSDTCRHFLLRTFYKKHFFLKIFSHDHHNATFRTVFVWLGKQMTNFLRVVLLSHDYWKNILLAYVWLSFTYCNYRTLTKSLRAMQTRIRNSKLTKFKDLKRTSCEFWLFNVPKFQEFSTKSQKVLSKSPF